MEHYIGEWSYCNFVAGSFHTKKLCNRLYMYSMEVDFYSKNEKIAF